MERKVNRRKKIFRWALGVVVLVDLVLLVVVWRGVGPGRTPGNDLEKLRAEHRLLKADVDRVSAIRQRMPEVQRDFDRFFAEGFHDAATGYSSIISDLGGIAQKAGLRTDNIAFRQHEITGRGVIEVEVGATIEGDYPSLVSFINGLERSRNFYMLDSLSLASGTTGNLKLNIQLRTYFRS